MDRHFDVRGEQLQASPPDQALMISHTVELPGRLTGVPCISLIVALSGTSGCPASNVARGMRPVTEGRWLMFRITQPRCGSTATLPQFVPPITPGYWIVPPRLDGVKMPSLR
jgi:hypothetical protein